MFNRQSDVGVAGVVRGETGEELQAWQSRSEQKRWYGIPRVCDGEGPRQHIYILLPRYVRIYICE